jgi:hypothetical protein
MENPQSKGNASVGFCALYSGIVNTLNEYLKVEKSGVLMGFPCTFSTFSILLIGIVSIPVMEFIFVVEYN